MKQNVMDHIAGFNSRFEGRMPHMYLDVKGLVTTGIGNLLATSGAAVGLPYLMGAGGAPAGSGDKSAGWTTIHDMPKGLPVSRTAGDAYGAACPLRLDEAGIDSLVASKAVAFFGDLKNQFAINGNPACYDDFDNFCADAQLGLLSMEWPGSFNKFVNFKTHIRNGHWFAAARECFFQESDNKGIAPRNDANRELFCTAGRVKALGLDPTKLYYYEQGINKVFLVKGGQCLRYDWDLDQVDGSVTSLAFFKLPAPFNAGVDAVFNGFGTRKLPGYLGHTYFVKGDQYVRFNWDLEQVDVGPLPLSKWDLPAGFAEGIDGAVNGQGKQQGKLYFFKGDKYVRYDWAREKIDVKPASIAQAWSLPEPFASGIDAVIGGEGPSKGKLYFFKGSEYIRFNWDPYYTDGPVRSIAAEWNGVSQYGFDSNLTAFIAPPGRQ